MQPLQRKEQAVADLNNTIPTNYRRRPSKDMIGGLEDFVGNEIAGLGYPVLVKVKAVHADRASLAGTVDVLPLVAQTSGDGRIFERAEIGDVPYLRIQGGQSAIVIDPKPGDIGFIVIAGRDMTGAIAVRDVAPPSTARVFSTSDCVYVGGFLNDAPTQFIQATENGWRIVTPGDVSIEAQGNVNIKAASVTANCDISTSGDVKAGGISLKNHTHGGVQSGGSSTQKPQ